MALVHYLLSLKPETAPVCSICIANYNGVHMLAECLDSVLAQDVGVPVEIIVHDDASTDGSVAWIRRHYPNIELIAVGENAGFCVANNRMVAHARGEYVLLLNNDAALYPDALRTLLAAARDQPSRGVFTLPQHDWESAELVDRGCLLDPFYNPVPNLDPARQDVAYAIGACLFLSRELWNHLGGFPEWIESIGEDLYLCCLARLQGLPVVVTAYSGYRHRQGVSFGGNRVDQGRLRTTYRRRALSERNKTAVMVICTPTAWMWPLLASHLMLLAIEGAVLVVLKRDTRIWSDIYGQAIGYAFRELGNMRARRREVQRLRQTGVCTYWRAFVWSWHKLGLLRRHGVPAIR